MNNNQNNNQLQFIEAIKNGQFEDVENIVADAIEQKGPESLIELADADNENNLDPSTHFARSGNIIKQKIADLREAQSVFQKEVKKYELEIKKLEKLTVRPDLIYPKEN